MIVVHGVGPVYWGVERELVDTALWTPAWLVEDLPPYRRSVKGFRLRIAHDTAIHFGVCKRGEDPHRKLRYQPTDIGKWGTNGVPETQDDGGTTASDEAGSLVE